MEITRSCEGGKKELCTSLPLLPHLSSIRMRDGCVLLPYHVFLNYACRSAQCVLHRQCSANMYAIILERSQD
jgi:hypothetical protein